MRRKLIKQGGYGLTFYVPKKWVDSKGLKAGDEINISEEDNKLIIEPGETKKQPKKTEITINMQSFNIYRSLIGSLYRAGYDEIKVIFDDRKIIPELQKTIDSLYGFEIFDIDEKSCTIKSVYSEETTEIASHTRKMIHIIKTMQDIILEDIRNNKFISKKELFEFRSNILKQRDIIARVIVQKRSLTNKTFPHYLISNNLWNIARNYYNLYSNTTTKVKKSDIDFLIKTNKYFAEFFERLEKHKLVEKHKTYRKTINEGISLIKTNNASIIISYCINILMLIQSCNSQILLTNH
ncbi:hypothetical protein COV16_01800 [Candidatus Woesearchaeota archaeon CG10_big_fil_rev_8_21_14_0_10_34_8]|nr:MAG: hypothetical protein COV16_01800 [Candidatus Woesearchaeota archaeon CG10_big_fil_rev_8_21_14_0_10_34_8]